MQWKSLGKCAVFARMIKMCRSFPSQLNKFVFDLPCSKRIAKTDNVMYLDLQYG
jgi:hypothetical protein